MCFPNNKRTNDETFARRVHQIVLDGIVGESVRDGQFQQVPGGALELR